MEVTREQIDALLRLQQIDLDLMRMKKQFDELPQRALIMAAREKKAGIAEKQAKVAALKRETAKRLTRINDEDASLAKKQQGVQAAIEAAQGNYRNVEARTKELEGIAKRRAVLSDELDKITAEISKIEDLEAQIGLALEEVTSRENDAIESFKQEGGALKMNISRLEHMRADVASVLPKAVLDMYSKAAARSAGVAIARLDGTRCGACRTGIEGGRLIELKSQAPLGSCPHCKRLLIIE